MAPPACKRRRPAVQLLLSSYLYVDKDRCYHRKSRFMSY